MSANVEAMVRAGVKAYRAGNKSEARTLLQRALEIDEYNEQAWLWLSAVVETPEEQQTCLENVLVINPGNERARDGLKSLGIDPDLINTADSQSDSSASSPFTDTSFADTDDAPFAEDQYVMPTSSSSAQFMGQEPTAADYDEWLEDLNLSPGGTQPAYSADVFGDNPFQEDDYSQFVEDEPEEDNYSEALAAQINRAAAPMSYDFDEPAVEEEDEFDTELDDDADIASEPVYDPYAVTDYNDADPDDYFRQIPEYITATRLPGTDETIPRPMLIGIIVLAVMNIGAMIFLISQLS